MVTEAVSVVSGSKAIDGLIFGRSEVSHCYVRVGKEFFKPRMTNSWLTAEGSFSDDSQGHLEQTICNNFMINVATQVYLDLTLGCQGKCHNLKNIEIFIFKFLIIRLKIESCLPHRKMRSDLLSDIRKGCKLKPVEEREVKPISNPPPKSRQIRDFVLKDCSRSSLTEIFLHLLERRNIPHKENKGDRKMNNHSLNKYMEGPALFGCFSITSHKLTQLEKQFQIPKILS
ncbi:hypothetical protein NQ317_007970 [Molorchus minor]|uniref:WH2 domain-containing protein n=1 Tax=Molorchus minor TaxID=1323400 RepID=A0ABQ9JKB7_9CUCU|nr:hypothetical protein NQ317_007970 [Molorchus minor]